MRSGIGILFTAIVLAGCGQPGTLDEKADEAGSIAAEGALLAHDAAEGDTFSTFTRVHAEALRERAHALRSRVSDERLRRVVDRVAELLRSLADDPGDRAGATEIERRLERAAQEAENIP